MKNFIITWREKKQLLTGKQQATDAMAALVAFRLTNPVGSFPVSGTLRSDGNLHKVVKADGSCYAILVEV